MPEIPVGRIEFRVSGRKYELSGPDICVQPPVSFSAAALVNAANKEGAKLERQRIRTKVEEMRKFHLDKNETSNTITYPWIVLEELLRWLDEEAS